MKKISLILLGLGFTLSAYSQSLGLTKEILGELQDSYVKNVSNVAISNALNACSISTLAVNSENRSMIDTHFTYEVKTKGRTDQESSGRCWLFTGLNVLRAEMIDRYNLGTFYFSQNYIFFYDQLEKANLFLQGVIDTKSLPMNDRKVEFLFKNPIGDGGQFTGVADLVMKYGLVPSEVMPETYCSNNTRDMRAVLMNKLREDGLRLRQYAQKMGKLSEVKLLDNLNQLKVEQLKDIYRILVLCLGEPPKNFTWSMYDKDDKLVSTKEYTPKSFFTTYFNHDLSNDYVMLMNDPSRDYNKVYEIDYDRHVYDGHNWKYINLPMDKIKEMAIASIKDNKAMYFSCDVGKFLDKKKGVLDINNFNIGAIFNVKFGMDKRERILTFASGSSHAMTLIAVDLDGNKTTKWMVENSWGATYGYKGNLIMTDKWFDEYMFRVVVNKKYITDFAKELLKKKPILLPAWDPMFSQEN